MVCITGDSAWSEYACVPGGSCFVLPDSMSFEDAAAIPVTYLTAYFMLFLCASLGQRKSVLIHMAAGGVVRTGIKGEDIYDKRPVMFTIINEPQMVFKLLWDMLWINKKNLTAVLVPLW